MSALGNSFTDSYNQPSTNNCQEEAGLNGTLKRSPKFFIKEPLQTKNKKISSQTQPQTIANRSILTLSVVQK